MDAGTQAIMEAWFGDKTSTSFKSFRNEVNKVDVPIYNIIINSPGGHVGDALAIHDWIGEMRTKGKRVYTKGIGVVASASTFILLAGEEPEMTENSYFMIHNVSGGVYGSVDQVENYAATMRLFNNNARDLYANTTGKRPEDISKLMNKETFMTAKQAQEHGFIKKVTGAQKFTNRIEPETWMYADTAILNKYNENVQTSNTEDMKEFFAQWGQKIMDGIKNLKPKEDAKPQEIVDQIAQEIGNKFKDMGEGMETAIQNFVTTIKLTASIDAATEKRIKDLETGQATLTDDIENAIGGETKPKKEDVQAYVPKGGFKND